MIIEPGTVYEKPKNRLGIGPLKPHALTFLTDLLRRTRIQNRLAVSFAVLTLVPLMITGLYAYYNSSEAIKAKISTYSIQVTNQVSENVKNELLKLENDSVDIAFSDLVQYDLANYDNMSEWEKKDTEAKIQRSLTKRLSFFHSVSDVLVYTKKGDKIIAYGDTYFKFRLKMDYLKKLIEDIKSKNGVPLWTIEDGNDEEITDNTWYRANNYGKAGIMIARSFKSLDQGFETGYIIIRIDEKYITNIIKDINIGSGSSIFILDSSGTVISGRGAGIDVAKPYENTSLINELVKNRENGVFSFNSMISGKRSLIAYTYIPRSDWYVVSIIPFSYLDAESMKIGINIAILGIICFLFALLVSFLVSRSISKPLNNLVASMNNVKKGNFTVRMPDDSRDELGEVTSNFNNMMKEIRYLIEEVKSKENLKRIAELKTLQAQINPHFLSNTLNTVRWLANIQKAENISSITKSLIQLLQGCMGKGSELVTIREEVEYIKNYLNIMDYRYYDKFKVHFEIEEGIMEFKILRLILQPIVENSLIHGLEPMDGQGIIVLKGYRTENELRIKITDNGVGISADNLTSLMQDEPSGKKPRLSGIGIRNVDERIKLYFGEEYGVTVESVPNLFTTVEINIPIVEKGEADHDAESADSRR